MVKEYFYRAAREWCPPKVAERLRAWRQPALSAWRTESRRLLRLPRFEDGTSTLLGVPIRFVDAASFLFTAEEIFQKKIYEFEAGGRCPRIIDCGANVGVSVLYFKTQFPEATVEAYEADPVIFEVLRANVESLGLKEVILFPSAVSNRNGTARFLRQGGDAGRLSGEDDGGAGVTVTTTRLRERLGEHVDLLKIDIEGAEGLVLADCAGALENVERVFVEYHSLVGKPQDLNVVIDTLTKAGFRLYIDAFAPAAQPFVKANVRYGMDAVDMALNIWARRE